MGVERSVRLTAEGVERLKVELEEVRTRRQDLYRTVQDANTNNEASDSGEYEEIKDDLVYAEARVRELEQILKTPRSSSEAARTASLPLVRTSR